MPEADERAFEAIVARLEYPMYIVTTAAGEQRAGCLVGFSTQCSIDPARFLVCISDKNRTCRVAASADALAVHLVPARGGGLVELFGATTGDDADKFARCDWSEGPQGLPVIAGCPWFAGRIVERARLGDHIGHVLEPFAGSAGEDEGQFPASKARTLEPGHEA